MRSLRPLVPAFAPVFLLLLAPVAIGQIVASTVSRNTQAVALTEKAIAAMGTAPMDSTATSATRVFTGSRSQAGTIVSALSITEQSGQQDAGSALSGRSLLQTALATLVGNAVVSDVTLSGSAHKIAGATDENGSVTYRVISTGAARYDFSYPSGTISEVRSARNSNPSGFWISEDGATHAIPQHNLWTNVSSFPAFTLGQLLSSQNSVITLVGQETIDGRALYHVASWQQFPQATGAAATLLQHLSQMDLYLDVSTLLPAEIDFNVHPDNDALTDIAVKISYSDYKAVNNVQTPFHVQKFLNNSLMLDMQFQNALINSGLSASSLGLQ